MRILPVLEISCNMLLCKVYESFKASCFLGEDEFFLHRRWISYMEICAGIIVVTTLCTSQQDHQTQ